MTSASVITFPAPAVTPDLSSGSILFIGNATVLLQFGGFTVLTDPTFIHMHDEVALGYGLHSKRLTNPARELHELPPLDLIVLSHFHGDHFDQVAERELDKGLPIVTTPEAAKELRQRGFHNLHALEQWQELIARKGDVSLRLTATPGRHGPLLADLVMPEVMGSVWEFQASSATTLFRMYVTGDTLVIDDLAQIPRRYPDIDLALLHLGGTKVMGVMVTMDARQGVEMVRLINPRRAIPIHYNDYDVFTSTLADFQQAVEAAGLGERIHYLRHGETYTFEVPRSRSDR